jgi:polyhydroxyalkanoate synthesis regulator phasin
MSENEGTKFLEDLQKRYDETQQKLEEKLQKAVKDFMKKADVVTGDELKGLKKEIRDLKKAISEGTDASK